MTPKDFKEKMLEIEAMGRDDIEASHAAADDLLCDVLAELGYIEGVNVYQELEKWYA